MEEEREGMNGWGRRAEGQTGAACSPERPLGHERLALCFLLSLLLPGSVYSIRRSTQAGQHARRDEKHTLTGLTADRSVHKETSFARILKERQKRG